MTAKPQNADKKPETVRQTVERLLGRTKKPYVEVRDLALREHPGAHTSVDSVRWYASRMRKAGKKVMERARVAVDRTVDAAEEAASPKGRAKRTDVQVH